MVCWPLLRTCFCLWQPVIHPPPHLPHPHACPTCLQDAKALLAQQRELQFSLQEAQEEAAAARIAAHESEVRARPPACLWAGLHAGIECQQQQPCCPLSHPRTDTCLMTALRLPACLPACLPAG